MVNKEMVEEVLEKEIRPYLAEHNGNIELVKIEDGIIEVRLLGTCANCPSAKDTVEDIIDVSLKRVPEVKGVIIADPISDEMWDYARKILNKEKTL